MAANQQQQYRLAWPITATYVILSHRGPNEPCGLSYSARCVLAPPDEYDGSICAAAAMRSVAAITVADVRISQPGEV